MFEHDLEKISSAVYKHSANLKGYGFSANKFGGISKKLAEFYLQDLQLFGCMAETTMMHHRHRRDDEDKRKKMLWAAAAPYLMI